MDITVYHPDELSSRDRAAWADLQSPAAQSGSTALANPFLSYQFAAAVGRHHPGVHVAVVREGGEPTAFFPFQRGLWGVGKAVGLGLSDCQGMVHRPGFQGDARELLTACSLVIWDFDHLTVGQNMFEESIRRRCPSPVIDTQGTYQEYLARLRSRFPHVQRVLLRQERRLGAEVGEVRYVHDERDPAMLRTLMRWKSAQYRRTGRSDRFAQPWIVRLLDDLFHTRAGNCTGLLCVLYAGERPLAINFGLRSQHVLAGWFSVYDPAYGKRSPGMLMHLKMVEGAGADGLTYLDLGRGEKWYKDVLKTRDLMVAEGWVTRPHPVALAYQAGRGPLRTLRNTVVERPELFGPADKLLKQLGRLRSALRPAAAPGPMPPGGPRIPADPMTHVGEGA